MSADQRIDRIASAPAEAWRRLASWTTDLVVVGIAVWAASVLSGGLGLIVLVAGLPVYYVILVGRLGIGTLGHQALRLRVRDDRTGETIGEFRAALRLAIGLMAMAPLLLGAIISAVGVVRRPDHRAWHDLATQSSVTST